MNPTMNSGNSNHSSLSDMSNRLTDDLRNAVAEGGKTLQEKASASVDALGNTRSRIDASFDGAQTRLQEAGLAVSKKAREAAEVSVHYVKENPWKTVGAVALAGFLARMLLKRRT